MIQYASGNIFDFTPDEVEAIVVSVNCSGSFAVLDTMGNQFINQPQRRAQECHDSRYMPIAVEFKARCDAGEVQPGDIWPYLSWHKEEGEFPPLLILCPTREQLDSPSSLEWVKLALERLAIYCVDNGVARIAIPLLGTGLGRLSANEVARLTRDIFTKTDGVTATLMLPLVMLNRIANKERATIGHG